MMSPTSAQHADMPEIATSPVPEPDPPAGSESVAASESGYVDPLDTKAPATRSRRTARRSPSTSRAPREAPPAPESPPDLELVKDGALYLIPIAVLEQYVRFSADQMVAVRAMQDAGVPEETIQQAFPKVQAAPPQPVNPVVAPVGAQAPPAAPGPPQTTLSAAPDPRTVPPCFGNHRTQELHKPSGNVRCAKCETVIIPGTGVGDKVYTRDFVPVKNYRSAQGAYI